MFPIVEIIRLAIGLRKQQRQRAEEERQGRGDGERKVLLRFVNDELAGTEIPPHIHGSSWRGTDSERITNSRQPYPGT